MWCGHCTRYCGWPDAVCRVEATFVVDLCSLIQHCALESLKEALCMSVWPFSHGHMCIFIICVYFTLLFIHVLLQALTVRSPLVSCVCE